ncbi:hypothetical protein BAU27_18665 [Bacillus sp. NH11B]|uniref:Uncharacterized protein n=1 Tax=Bacillus proteolyticus TaxID=2026192 RepID=A0AA44R6T2_9BACI|nr:hypothetical protein BAU27_18665 [Bacillus sp. NH11B]OJE43507.1 hypothetical protein BAQ49_10390 [Bacillus proteolyticus]
MKRTLKKDEKRNEIHPALKKNDSFHNFYGKNRSFFARNINYKFQYRLLKGRNTLREVENVLNSSLAELYSGFPGVTIRPVSSIF